MTTGARPDGVHVIDRGAKDSPPLLFVHGWGVSSAALIEAIDRLAEHHRVLAPDLPGFGRSRALAAPVSYAAYADVLARLLTDRGIERADVAGFSMGGGIALTFARHYPRRLRKLVLIGPAGCLDTGRSPAQEILSYLGEGALQMLHPPEWHGKWRVVGSLCRNLFGHFATMLATMRMARSQSVVAHAGDVAAPTLLVWGERDLTMPLRLAPQFLERLADGRLHTIPLAYHDVISTRPRQTAAVIHGFLAESPDRAPPG